MSKLTCIVLCVVAARLNYVHVVGAQETLRDALKPSLKLCSEEYEVSQADIKTAAETGNKNIIPPCYSGCVFKKVGFIDSQGQYDLDTGLAYLKKAVHEKGQYLKLEKVAKRCASVKDKVVSDGEAGCEMGALVSACFLDNRDSADI